MRRSPFLHPILLALFPIAFLAVHNVGELGLSDLVRPLVISITLAVAMILISRPIFKSWRKAGIAASLTLILFYSFGHLATMLRHVESDLGWSLNANWATVTLLTLVWLTGWTLIVRDKHRLRKFTIAANLVAAGLLALQLVQGAYALATVTPPEYKDEVAEAPLTARHNTPDIYYIILDAYGRADIQSEIYGYDSQWFVEHLQRHGFYVATQSHSNYCQTALSLSATLNLNYLDSLGSFNPGSWDKGLLTPLLCDNQVFQALRAQGYHLTAFSSGFPPTEFDNADTYITSSTYLSEFEMTVLGTTPLPFLLRSVTSEYDLHRQRINSIFSGLEHVELSDSPQVVFAHLMCPHPPFVFTETGGATQPDRPFYLGRGTHFYEKGGTPEEYVKGYHDQVAYVTVKLQQTIDHILERYGDHPPIIIIQGDHGPGSRLYWQNVKKTDIHECFSIFNAILLPDGDYSLLYPSISSVNTFRVVFDCYFGAHLPLLPDRSFFSAWTRPYLFFDVTAGLQQQPGVVVHRN